MANVFDVSFILEAPQPEVQKRQAFTCGERPGRPIPCVVDPLTLGTGAHSLCQNLPWTTVSTFRQ